MEGNEIDVCWPFEVADVGQFGEFDSNSQQSVDESVEVEDDVGVQIIDDVYCIASRYPFIFLYFVRTRYEFPQQKFALHEVVILC